MLQHGQCARSQEVRLDFVSTQHFASFYLDMNESSWRLWEGTEELFFFLFYRSENTTCSHWQSKDKNLEQFPSSLTSPIVIMPQHPQGHAAIWVFLLLHSTGQTLEDLHCFTPASPGKSSSSLSPLTPHREIAQSNASSCLRSQMTLWHPGSSLGGTVIAPLPDAPPPCKKGGLAVWLWEGSEGYTLLAL